MWPPNACAFSKNLSLQMGQAKTLLEVFVVSCSCEFKVAEVEFVLFSVPLDLEAVPREDFFCTVENVEGTGPGVYFLMTIGEVTRFISLKSAIFDKRGLSPRAILIVGEKLAPKGMISTS